MAARTCPTCHGGRTILVSVAPNGQREDDNVQEVEQKCPTCEGTGSVETPDDEDERDGDDGKDGRR
jgi:hypothetical protein